MKVLEDRLWHQVVAGRTSSAMTLADWSGTGPRGFSQRCQQWQCVPGKFVGTLHERGPFYE